MQEEACDQQIAWDGCANPPATAAADTLRQQIACSVLFPAAIGGVTSGLIYECCQLLSFTFVSMNNRVVACMLVGRLFWLGQGQTLPSSCCPFPYQRQQEQQQQHPSQQSDAFQPPFPVFPPAMNESPVLLCDSVDMGNPESVPLRGPAEGQAPGGEDINLYPLPPDGMALEDDWVSVHVLF